MEDMPRWPLNLSYKGERNYIQGGDIYNAINTLAPDLLSKRNAYLRQIVFKKFCRRDPDVCLERPKNAKRLVAMGECASGTDFKKPIWVVESDRFINNRYAFEEERIISSAEIVGERISLQSSIVYTPIEDVIILTKALTYKLIPKVAGKWVFGQLDLIRPFLNGHSVIVIERKHVIGRKFTLNAIFQDGIHIGDIRFIGGQP